MAKLNPKYNQTKLYKVALQIAVGHILLYCDEDKTNYNSTRQMIIKKAKKYIDNMELKTIDR